MKICSIKTISRTGAALYGKKNITTAEEWLLDNYYIIERDIKDIKASVKRRDKDLARLAARAVRSFGYKADEASLDAFLEQNALRSDRLAVFTLYLKAAVIEHIGEMCKNIAAATGEEMGNCIQSLVALGDIDMGEKQTRFCACDRVLASEFKHLTAETRDLYRRAALRLALKSGKSENIVAENALSCARSGKSERESCAGYYLVGEGREVLCKTLGIRASKNRSKYIYISLTAVFFAALTAWAYGDTKSAAGLLLLAFPAFEIAVTFANFIISRITKPRILPALDFDGGIPKSAKTAVVYPVLLTGEESAAEMCERLEVCYHANKYDNLVFVLLGDLKDAVTPSKPDDERIVGAAEEGITRLCEKYGHRFFLFVRRREWNEKQGKYMAWERKRGALVQLCSYLRGEGSFDRIVGDTDALQDIKYILTLDSDTVLPIGGAAKLCGAAAHPLNKAVTDSDRRIVTKGYGIIKPKVSLDAVSASRTAFSRIFAGQGGTDPYSASVSDLYMDVFGDAIFTGKGIFDIDAYLLCAKESIPENTVLSHDLLEGSYLRCALCTGAEVYDGYPSGFDGYSKRLHRWIRGDWQLLPWLMRRVKTADGKKVKNEISALSKWKITDNLRRSITPFFQAVLLIFAGAFSSGFAAFGVGLVMASLVLPLLLYVLDTIFSRRALYVREKRNSNVIFGAKALFFRFILGVSFLAYQGFMAADAAVRTVYRISFTKKHTLEWVTAADAERGKSGGMAGYYSLMASSVAASALTLLISFAKGGEYAGTALIFAVIWAFAPALAYIISRDGNDTVKLSGRSRKFLLETARKIWQFFEDYTQSTDNFLPPDNVQFRPYKGAAHRTSPTNIGLYLLAVLGARDLGFITTETMEEKIAATLDTVEKLEKWRGHLLNWYDTVTLKPLYPRYVSTVDSGNFICYMMTVSQGLREYGGAKSELLSMRIDKLVSETHFKDLFDSKKKLFSIGYNIEEARLSPSYYDILASEARQSVFLAAARGEIKPKDWFRLSRTLTGSDGYKGLISWTGTMFEYLMPLIIMKNYKNTLLDEGYFFALHCQKKYAHKRRVPWGTSESAFYGFDVNLNYRYKAFGVPALGVKRGLADDVVVSPYSTMLALAVNPKSAVYNLLMLKKEGAEGDYGFYEAIDYTPSRTQGRRSMICKSYMAHHQGMGFASIVNALCDEAMQKRFHSYPEVKAAEPLLQEKVPVRVKVTKEARHRIPPVKNRWRETAECIREFENDRSVLPKMTVLSNGSYTVLLDTHGEGVSSREGVYLGKKRPDPGKRGSGINIFVKTADKTAKSAYDGRCIFTPSSATFKTDTGEISTDLKICVMPEDCAELRRMSIVNKSGEAKEVEVIAYTDLALDTYESESAHSVFSGLFLTTELKDGVLLAKRRTRSEGESEYTAFFTVSCDGAEVAYEADRAKFLGRGNTVFDAVQGEPKVENTTGNTLESCFAARVRLNIPKGESASLCIAAGICETREKAVQTAKKYSQNAENHIQTARAVEKTALCEGEEELFLSVLPLLYYGGFPCERQRECIRENKKSLKELWKLGISGDLPIAVLRISDSGDIDFLAQFIRAHAYFMHRGIHFDLAVLCDEAVGYSTPLFDEVKEHIPSGVLSQKGGIFIIGGQEILPGDKTLLVAASRLYADAKEGGLESVKTDFGIRLAPKDAACPETKRAGEELHFYNSYGGFNGKNEYVITAQTPAPWVNVVSNGDIGFVAGENGGGYTWYKNSHEMRLTEWHNDPVTDAPTEIFKVLDGDRLLFETGIQTETRHGAGYTEYTNGDVSVTAFAPPQDGVKIIWAKVKNRTNEAKKYKISYLLTPVCGVKMYDTRGRLKARKTGGAAVCENAFEDGAKLFLSGAECFLKLRGTGIEIPEAYGDDFYIEAVNHIEVSGFGTGECVFLLGAAEDDGGIQKLSEKYKNNAAAHFAECKKFFSSFSNIKVTTPDESFDRLVNDRLLYQSAVCRLFGRSGFYQSGGAYGFRDQLQDVISLLYARPDLAKEQILRAAAHQFTEGDAMHWWHEGAPDKGVRTRISDDRLWLVYVVCEYIKVTGDFSILQEEADYIIAEPLKKDENERYFEVCEKGGKESLYAHCRRAVDASLRFGQNGLPLIGGGDWNDGFNRVGLGGKGESVWLSFFMIKVLREFAPVCREQGDTDTAKMYENCADKIAQNIEQNAWDGEWYKRAFYDDGRPIGSKENAECYIDSVSQSWAVISGAADKKRAEAAVKSALEHLFDRKNGIVKLLTPPFDKSAENPGYIKSYIPGVRENGGQYTHAAVWLAIACAELGMNNDAAEIFAAINPINRTKTAEGAQKYKTEPYALAADIYSAPPNEGRGGWSWYTGAASWMYVLAVRYILGIQKEGDTLTVTPSLPDGWNGYEVIYTHRETEYKITVNRTGTRGENAVKLVNDGKKHELCITF